MKKISQIAHFSFTLKIFHDTDSLHPFGLFGSLFAICVPTLYIQWLLIRINNKINENKTTNK